MLNPDPRLPGVSIREAADKLGVSASTVRRLVKDGKLEGAYFDRKGGSILRIILPDAKPTPDPNHPIESEAAPNARQDVSEIVRAATEPLSAALAAERAEKAAMLAENATLRERAASAETRAEYESTRAKTAEATIATMSATNAEQARALNDARKNLARVPGWLRRLFGVE